MRIKKPRKRTIIIIVIVILGILFVINGLTYPKKPKPYNHVSQDTLKKSLATAIEGIKLEGYIEQQIYAHHEAKDFYGKTRKLNGEVANYYYNSKILMADLTSHFQNVSWKTENKKFCASSTVHEDILICVFLNDKTSDSDFMGYGADDLWIGHNNMRNISKPYNLSISAVDSAMK